MAGRPTSLTPELAARILRRVRQGVGRQVAAVACGVSKNQVRNWEKRGLEGEEPYASFAADLHEAEALCEARWVAKLQRKELKVPWQLVMTLLERRFPDRWSVTHAQARREAREEVLSALRSQPKLHAEVANALAAERDSAPGTDAPH